MSATLARLPQVPREEIDDPELEAILERAERVSAPKPAWYLTIAHNPEMTKAFAVYWETTHRGGRLDHVLKELVRISIAEHLSCRFCADQRSVPALEQGLDEADVAVCSLPGADHPDPRTRAALRFARALVLEQSPDAFDPVYAEVREQFTEAEVVELALFAANAIGGIILCRSLRIDP